MTKKIVAFFLCVALILGLCSINIYATENLAGTGSYTVTADKSIVNRGDTITFTITLQQKGLLGGYQAFVSIPDGLTLVAGTFRAPENLKETLKMDNLSTDETPKMQTNAYGSQLNNSYSGEEPVVLATFQCTVDNDAKYGDVEVTLTEATIQNEMGDEKTVTVVPVKLTIEQIQVPATGISLSKTKIELTEGEEETIVATVFPDETTDKTVEWSSNRTDIATVDSTGKITAVKKGNAIITAKTVNGKVATCEVKVNCGHSKTTTYPAIESTCILQGNSEYKKCDNCGEIVEGSDAKLPLESHNYGTEIDEVPATHSQEGTKAHYKCSVCPKLFVNDGVKMIEVTAEYLKLDVVPHTYNDSYQDETYHKRTCDCEDVVIEKHKGGIATCKDQAICEVCNYEYGTINKDNHVNTKIINQKKADIGKEGYTGDIYCNDCEEIVEKGSVIPKLVYKILSGANSEREENSDIALIFKIDGEIGKFRGIKINDKEIDKSNYKVESGSTMVILESKYLNTLNVGEYKIAFVYEDAEVETNFKVTKKIIGNAEVKADNTNNPQMPSNNPQTGDNIMLWSICLIVSGIGFVTLVIWNIKKQEKISRVYKSK